MWVPAIADASFWYIAQGPDAGGKPSYAIVVRGTTLLSIQSLKEDFEVTLKPLPFTDPTAPADVRIAKGSPRAMETSFAPCHRGRTRRRCNSSTVTSAPDRDSMSSATASEERSPRSWASRSSTATHWPRFAFSPSPDRARQSRLR